MREIFTYGSVGGAPGNRCFYLEVDNLLNSRWSEINFSGCNKIRRHATLPLTQAFCCYSKEWPIFVFYGIIIDNVLVL